LEQRPKFRKSSSLLPRTLSALFLIPVCLYTIYLGFPYSLVLGGLVTGGLCIEWVHLWLKCSLPSFPKAIYGIIGTAYLGIATYWFLNQVIRPDGWQLVYWLFFLVWSTDIAAYVGGKFLKGPKLVPSISPNKTWSGFLVGFSVGFLVAYGTSLWLFSGVFTFWQIALLILIAEIGDLIESQAKRWSHIKDSSHLIPGHGGLLDRLDSLIAVSFSLAIWEMWR
jgi:phosphatidate cytidylyltransferase